jgi:hypothetical protein
MQKHISRKSKFATTRGGSGTGLQSLKRIGAIRRQNTKKKNSAETNKTHILKRKNAVRHRQINNSTLSLSEAHPIYINLYE